MIKTRTRSVCHRQVLLVGQHMSGRTRQLLEACVGAGTGSGARCEAVTQVHAPGGALAALEAFFERSGVVSRNRKANDRQERNSEVMLPTGWTVRKGAAKLQNAARLAALWF